MSTSTPCASSGPTRSRAIKGQAGSVTQLPVLTMPAGDVTHPVPDTVGYITEGQLVLSPELHAQGLYPPFDALGSLSRLMRLGAGPGRTRDDHLELAAQLYALAAQARRARELAEELEREDGARLRRVVQRDDGPWTLGAPAGELGGDAIRETVEACGQRRRQLGADAIDPGCAPCTTSRRSRPRCPTRGALHPPRRVHGPGGPAAGGSSASVA